MSDGAVATKGLRASQVSWPRVRRIMLNCGIAVVAAGATTLYMDGGVGAFVLKADGIVTREHARIAVPFESRVTQVLVRPGAYVRRGQKVAVVQSPDVSRALANLAVETAHLISKVSELQTHRRVIDMVLPLAEFSNRETERYLNDLTKARTKGLAVNRSIQEMASAELNSSDKMATLTAERETLGPELEANIAALKQIEDSAEKLRASYTDGVLYANVSGYVGRDVAQVGEVLTPHGKGFADVFTGSNYVVAYLPDTYRRDIREGEAVRVSTPSIALTGRIDSILPMAESLPSEYQQPNKTPLRGRLVRVALTSPNQLPIYQRVSITGCWSGGCETGLWDTVWNRIYNGFSTVVLEGRSMASSEAAKPSPLATPQATPPG